MREFERKYAWVLAAGIGAVLAVSAGMFRHAMIERPSVRIDQATCDPILPGMTLAEVQKIIGGPDGWYGIS